MKAKITAFMLSLVVLLGFAMPSAANAQTTPQTIADIVVAQTKASTPEFTTLLAALQAADPAFLKALSDPKANYTVFAPTDAAFAQLIKALNTTPADLLKNTALLNAVLAYHVVPGTFDAKTISADNGAILGTALPDHALTITVAGGKVQLDKSNVVTADVKASNGIVHIIDTVLVPADINDVVKAMAPAATMSATMAATMAAPQTIADLVVASSKASTPEFSTLLAAVQAADPAVLATLSGTESFTVFAPTDAAFVAAFKALNTTPAKVLADKATLTGILLYHVVPGSLSSTALGKYLGTNASLKVVTLGGKALTVTANGGKVMIDKATVVKADVEVSNGLVHVIDGVLLPPQ